MVEHKNIHRESWINVGAQMAHFYEQYVHDLGDVLNRHAPLICRLTKKDSAVVVCLTLIDGHSPLGTSLKELGVGPRIHRTEVAFIVKLLSAMHL